MARFEVVALAEEEGHEPGDEIIIDIPEPMLDKVFKQIELCKKVQDAQREKGQEPRENAVWACFHLVVKASHQKFTGPAKPDGSPPDESYAPFLLPDEPEFR